MSRVSEKMTSSMSRAWVRTDSCPDAPSACLTLRESKPCSERLPEEFEPKATPVFGALGPCLGTPGPAKQLDGHDRRA